MEEGSARKDDVSGAPRALLPARCGAALPLTEEIQAWVEVVDGWSKWESVPRGPSAPELKDVSACLRRLLQTLRADGEM